MFSRLDSLIFRVCFKVVGTLKSPESNCHFESDKVLICRPGTERLDITVDKWAEEQNWQDAREDKMPSARGFFFFFPSLTPLSVITAGQQLVKIPEFTDNIIILLAASLGQGQQEQIFAQRIKLDFQLTVFCLLFLTICIENVDVDENHINTYRRP